MKTRVQNAMLKVQNKWNELDKNQKIKLSVASLVLISVLVSTVFYVTRPNWYALMTNMEFGSIADAQSVLGDAGIEYKTSRNARDIYVKEEDATKARIVLSNATIQGVDNEFAFTDAIDLIKIGTSQTVQKETLLRAKESELAYSLRNFDGVESATVQISVPDRNNFFLDNGDDATAGVILNTSSKISDDQAEAIARYISRSVIGLDISNVEVFDENANNLFNGENDFDDPYVMGQEVENSKKYELENSIKGLVSALYDDVKIYANVNYNWDKVVEDQTIYTPQGDENTGIIHIEDTTKQNVENSATGVEPGLGNNDNQANNYVTAGNEGSSASSQSVSREYYVNQTNRVKEEASGTLNPDSSSVTLYLYDYVHHDEEYLTKNDLLDGMTWNEYKESVGYKILTVPDEILQTVASATGGIENVTVTAWEVPVFVDKTASNIDFSEYIIFGGLALLIILLALLIIKNTQVEEIEEVEPELSVEDLLVSTQLEEQIEQERLEELRLKQQSAVKEQIDKFVHEQPAAVANLLRTWINEEWE